MSGMEPTPPPPPPQRAGFLVAAVVLVTLAHVVLCALVSVQCRRVFTADSWIYVDVARHLVARDGFVQSAIGGNVPRVAADAVVPAPMTAHAPLFPAAIAALSIAGVPAPDGALLLPSLAYAAALAAGYALGRELGGRAAGFAAVTGLVLFEPVRLVSMQALSDVPALALALGGLALVVRARRTGSARAAAMAGALCGLAFAVRYAYVPLLPCAALAFVDVTRGRETIRRLATFAIPCLAIVAWVLLRNLSADGTLLGPARLASMLGLGENLVAVADVFAFWALQVTLPPYVQLTGLTLLFAAAVLADIRRPGTVPGAARRAPLAFALVYLAVLVAMRTVSHIDPINARLVLPAGAVLAAWAAATLTRAAALRSRTTAAIAITVLAFASVPEIEAWINLPRRVHGDEIRRSPRLTWVAQNVTPRDLVVGDDVEDVPFQFPGVHALSFTRWPYTEHPSLDGIRAFARAHSARFDRVFIVLRDDFSTREEWTTAYGPFIAELVFAEPPPYPGVERVAQLSDGYVLRLSF